MPVQPADIVQTAMDTGDAASTDCEQRGAESDEGVNKGTAPASVVVFSNQIHIAKAGFQRKQWKSGWALTYMSYRNREINWMNFSAPEPNRLWKT
jgi:hypothetical protein